MALSDSQKTSFVYKKAVAAVSETSLNRDFFEEPYAARDIVFSTQVWNQADQISATAPVLSDGATSGVVQYFSNRSMTAVSGTTNAFYLSDLVDAIPRVGPIVQQLGGSFKDTAAMMVAMKEAGVPAAQSANAIKSAMASLINPSRDAQKTFKSFGIDLAALSKRTSGNPILMIKELSAELKNLDKLTQAQLIEKLFGKFQFSRVQALLDNLNKAGSQAQTVFELMNASNQQLSSMAQAELKVQTESTTGRFKRAVESLKADLMPIGEQFTKVITKLVEFGDKIVEFANKLGPLKNLIQMIERGYIVPDDKLKELVEQSIPVCKDVIEYLSNGKFRQ